MPERLEFFAAAIPGVERALCDELRELGFSSVRLNRGGIPFLGTWEDGWRACLTSRIAQRIQVLMTRFPAPTEQALYDGVRSIDWLQFVTPGHTIAIKAVTRGSNLTHSGFAALKAKDAIVDQVREHHGERPSVDRDNPDLRVFLYLAGDRCTVYVDLAGEALHRRGYRTETGEAPLRETLAAALLRLSGWDRTTPLIDPMCGAGTITIEAALWAGKLAPGLLSEQFGFERWANFGEDERKRLRILEGELRREAERSTPRITAMDSDPTVLEGAKQNARSAGVRLAFRERDVLALQADLPRAQVVTNPPYGRRLELAPDFPAKLGAAVTRWHGWRVTLLAGSPLYRKSIYLKPESAVPVKNGDIDCEILTYEIP